MKIFVFFSILLLTGCATSIEKQDKKAEASLVKDFEQNRALKKEVKHSQVQKYVANYRNNPAIFNHLDKERLVILQYILSELERRGMPSELAMIPLVESSYRPAASNRGQYVGLWQFGSQTAKNFGMSVNRQYDGRYNVAQATKGALDYLEYLNKMFDGDWLLTVAAYNAGEGRVLNAIKANEKRNKKTDYWNLSLPNVTKEYIPKIIALSEVVSETNNLNVTKDQLPKLVRIRVDNPDKLKKVIKQSYFSKDVLNFYNPNVAKNMPNVLSITLPETELHNLKGLTSDERKKYVQTQQQVRTRGKVETSQN